MFKKSIAVVFCGFVTAFAYPSPGQASDNPGAKLRGIAKWVVEGNFHHEIFIGPKTRLTAAHAAAWVAYGDVDCPKDHNHPFWKDEIARVRNTSVIIGSKSYC